MRARYLFFGAALFGFLLVLFVFSARIMGWIGDKDLGQMLPIKQMKSLLAFEAFFFGVESEKRHYLIRTRILDPIDDNKFIQSHLNAMHILRMHAFDFGVYHRRLILRRLPAILVYMATAALFAYCLPGEMFISSVIGYTAFVFLAIMAGSESWYRAEQIRLNMRGYVTPERESREWETGIFVVEGLIWCWFFMLVGVFFSNLAVVHLNAWHYFSKLASRRESWAVGWLLAATVIHTQAHIKGRRQLRALRLVVAALLIADMLFFLPF